MRSLLRSFGATLVVVGLLIGSVELRADDPGTNPQLPCTTPTTCNAACTGGLPCPSATTCKLGPNCSGCTCTDRNSPGVCGCLTIYIN